MEITENTEQNVPVFSYDLNQDGKIDISDATFLQGVLSSGQNIENNTTTGTGSAKPTETKEVVEPTVTTENVTETSKHTETTSNETSEATR